MLTIRSLTKRFGDFAALKDVDLAIGPGEIHGLVGANGSGKSTLLNILFGNPVVAATGGYSGEIFLDGVPVRVRSPKEAMALGIGMIHQEFALLPGLSVAENILLGREPVGHLTRPLGSLALIDRKEAHSRAEQALRMLGADLDPSAPVADLSVAMQQFVEIAREVERRDLRLLLLDEPTTTLHAQDIEKLMEVLRVLAARGTAIVYVSHRLEEVLELCHSVTVLRDGQAIGRYDRAAFDLETIAEDMIGRALVKASKPAATRCGEAVIRLEGFSVEMPGEFRGSLDLEIRKGEILGLAGLSGQGRPALGYGIMGMYPTHGRVEVQGEAVPVLSPSAMIDRGVFLLPEDRRFHGLLLDHSVADNIVFTARQRRNAFLHAFPIGALRLADRRAARRYARECAARFNIGCRSVRQKVRELSGGNQQKVCLARALALAPEILFVSEPTRGVDIAAKELILDLLIETNRVQGTTLVLASSELEELQRVCDRIAVLYEGSVVAILAPDADERAFALAFAGERGVPA